jgi:autotransporter-associated beta strand protein
VKTSRTLPVFVTSLLSLVLAAIPLRASGPIVWTGGSLTDGSVVDIANWGGIPLTGLGTEDVSFGDTTGQTNVVVPPLGIFLRDVTFTGASRPAYTFDNSILSSLGLNGDLIVDTAGSDVTFNGNLPIALSGITHNVNLVSGSTVIINGTVSDVPLMTAAVHKLGDGTLALNGANTFSGGIDLAGGWLLLGHDSAAGTGLLTLSAGTLAPTANITLANAVSIGGGIKLGDCDTTAAITFSGVITGSGAFDAHGYGDITFAGNNSGWTGGIEFYGDNNVFVNHANGLGTGGVAFSSSSKTALHYNESATLSSLSGGSYASGMGSAVIIAATKVLTIDQDDETNTTYSGRIYGSGDGGLVKEGAGLLSLEGPVQVSGPIAINAGTLQVDGTNGYFVQSSAVTVSSNATLALRNGGGVESDVTVGSGGTLSGTGYVSNAIIQGGATLWAGTAGCAVGELDFADLTLEGLSKVVIGIKSDGMGGLENSEIYVQNAQTLTLSGVDASNKLTLKLISEGVLTGLTANHPYQLMFLDFNNQTGGLLDASNVTIDSSGLVLESGWVATDVHLSSGSNQYFVNFTPVPEPSTYMLMALGLAGGGFAAWRRRRQA